ncbi:MAG: aminoacetone oxidase family FAD-binding enzyme [Faecalibacterium sp.]
MKQILILGGGAAGLAAAIAAAQTDPGRLRVTVLERNPRVGKKLLATGNGRCNLDNANIAPQRYFTSDPAALVPLLAAIDRAAPLAWFESMGLYPRADEAGRIYPYSNQAADVAALLERQLERFKVQLRTGCTVQTLAQSRGGYLVQFTNADGRAESLSAQAVVCAMGGAAGPQFGTDGFGIRFAGQCGGRIEPIYPCLTALQSARPIKALAGLRAKATARLLDGGRVLAAESGEVQFTDYGLSGICIMQLSGLLAPGRGPKDPVVELDLFPALSGPELTGLLAAQAQRTDAQTPAEFWLGLLPVRLGMAVWNAAGLPKEALPKTMPPATWERLAYTARHLRFERLTPCGWKQAQTTGGGLALREVEPDTFQFKGCPGLYFVGETLDCAGSCGGYNLHWAFGSGLAAGRHAAHRCSEKKRG